MKAIVTGAKGTVGSALAALLKREGWEIAAWDRSRVPVDAYQPMEDFLRAERPDVLFHLAIASKPTGLANEGWTVNRWWPGELAWISKVLGFRLVFASTAMVFADGTPGPFTLATPANAPEGYGLDKRWAEERVLRQNPLSVVARLGWQIGEAPGSNNMIDFLEARAAQDGKISASRRWLPACSFLPDTAAALLKLAEADPGLYMIDSNREGWNFFELASALNAKHGGRWNVEPDDSFEQDQRMIDPRLGVPDLSERLEGLRR